MPMALLNPAALWLLLLVVLVLLLPRRPAARARRMVGNLYHWTQPVARDPMALAVRRLRRHRLVLLQAAFMTAVIAALARPAVPWLPGRVVLVLDASASMGALDGDATRLDAARAALAPVLASLPRGARVRLMVAGAFPADRGEFGPGDAALARALGAIRPSGGGADIASVVRGVRVASGVDPLIVVASDQPDGSGGDRALRWITVGHPAANVAITGLEARRFPAGPAGGEALASVRNYGPDPTVVDIEIAQDGRALERRTLRLDPGRPASVIARIADGAGVVRARLLTPDALAVDNERLAIVPARRRVRVSLIGGRHYFLAQALSAHPDLAVAAPASDPDLVVCDPCATLPAGEAGVLLISQGAVMPPAPLTISLPQSPLAAALDLPQALVSALDGPRPPSEADVVLRAGGAPALVAYERDGRRVVELRLDLEHDTRIPLSTAFPIIVDNVVGWLTRRDERQSAVLAGEPLRWRLPAAATPADGIVRGPDGAILATERAGATIVAVGAGAPGIYTIGDGRQVAVNAVTDGESNLSAAQPVSAAPETGAYAGRAGLRGELAAGLLVAALLVLCIEWWYRGGRAVQA